MLTEKELGDKRKRKALARKAVVVGKRKAKEAERNRARNYTMKQALIAHELDRAERRRKQDEEQARQARERSAGWRIKSFARKFIPRVLRGS